VAVPIKVYYFFLSNIKTIGGMSKTAKLKGAAELERKKYA
jgi:hypothetical protein